MIYHIVSQPDLLSGCDGAVYRPESLAGDGFVHCSLEASVVPVANDYYLQAEDPVLLLRIDPSRLSAETRYEHAAPSPGAALTHLDSAPAFPHVYGPIDLGAIDGVAVLRRTPGGYVWPEEFVPLDRVLPPTR